MGTVSDLDPSDLPTPLERLHDHPAVVQSVPTGSALLTDWFVEVDGDLPTDLIIPHDVFHALHVAGGEIFNFGPTERENWHLSGLWLPDDHDPSSGIDRLRESPLLDDVVEHTRPTQIEIVVDEQPDNHIFRLVQRRTRFRIANIQRHDHRDGKWSIYLHDPEASDGVTWTTLDDLLDDERSE